MNLLPERGFVCDYLRTYIHGGLAPLTDAPPTFHLAVAYALLSMGLMDRVRFPWAGRFVPPNLYVMLLAGSTRHRKSTALRLGLDVVHAEDDLASYLGPNEFSAEGFLKSLQEWPAQLLVLSEFGDFLALANTWGERNKPILMDLHDAPARYWKVLSRQEFKIQHPLVAVLAALNTALLSEVKGTQLDWRSGFFARFLMICPGDLDGGAVSLDWNGARVTVPHAADPGTVKALAERLSALRARAGNRPGTVLTFSGLEPGARQQFEAWAERLRIRAASADNGDLDAAPGLDRLQTHAMKLAALLTVDLTNARSEVIVEEAMTYALRFCTMAADSLAAIAAAYAPTHIARELDRVEAMIRRRGPAGISYGDLMRSAHLLAKDFTQIVNTLTATGRVTLLGDGKTSRYVMAPPPDVAA